MPRKNTQDTKPKPNSKLRMIENLYTFFYNAERTDRRFTIQDVCNESGHAFGTLNGYRTKKWFWFLHETEPDIYYCKGLRQLPKAIFIGIHQQKMIDIIGFLLAFFAQERRVRRASRPLPAIAPPAPQPLPTFHPLPWLFLLLIIAAWYRLSRRWRIKIWIFRIPL